MADPWIPTRPVGVWFYRYSEAILREDTFAAFVAEFPDDFPTVRGAS